MKENSLNDKCNSVFSPSDVENLVSSMLGQKLKTKQTTGEGVKVSKVGFLVY